MSTKNVELKSDTKKTERIETETGNKTIVPAKKQEMYNLCCGGQIKYKNGQTIPNQQ